MSESRRNSKRQHIDGMEPCGDSFAVNAANAAATQIETHIGRPDGVPEEGPREPLPKYLVAEQLDTTTIQIIVKDIQSSKSRDVSARKTVYEAKYPSFAESYPMLFDMACGLDFDYAKFNMMMSIREQIANKDRTVEDASKEIGQKFYTMYHN